MREEEFSYEIKKKALERASFKCERCWSERNLEFHHRSPVVKGGTPDLDNCIVLCSSCHDLAPDDYLLFDELFMRFASPKEMIKYYEVDTEERAIECWCDEKGYNIEDMRKKIELFFPSKKELIYHGMKQKVARVGGGLGGNTPYGYDSQDGKLVVNDEELRVVRYIFNEYLVGLTMKKIANKLDEKNVPTKKGGKWGRQTVASILKNPVYCGFIEWDNVLRKAEHETIINISTFNRVQREIVTRIRRPHQKYEPRILPENTNF